MTHAIAQIKGQITEILGEQVSAQMMRDRFSVEGDARTIEFWQAAKQAAEQFFTVVDEEYLNKLEMSLHLSDCYQIGDRATIKDESSPWYNYTGEIKGIGYESVTVNLRLERCVWVSRIFKPSQLGEPHQHSIGDWVYVSDETDKDFGRGGQIVKVSSVFDWVVDFNGFCRRNFRDEQLTNSDPSLGKEEIPFNLKQQYIIGKWHQITPKQIEIQSYLNNGKYALITWNTVGELDDVEPNITKVPIAQLEKYEREFYLTA